MINRPTDKYGNTKVFEGQRHVLDEPSGIVDNDGKTILTNLEAIRLIIEAGGGRPLPPSMNGSLSPEGRDHNSRLTREAGKQRPHIGDYVVAICAQYPPDSHTQVRGDL